jgi:hypothetical protein
MRKILFLTIFWVLIISQIACNQTPKNNTDSISESKSEKQKLDYPNLAVQAEEMKQAFIAKDFEKSYEFMHPKIVKMLGGKEKLIENLKSVSKQIEDAGVKVTEYSIQSPSQIVEADNQIFAVLPTTAAMSTPKEPIVMQESLIAVSEDNGNNWKFIRASSRENMKKLFPNVVDKLEFSEPITKPITK